MSDTITLNTIYLADPVNFLLNTRLSTWSKHNALVVVITQDCLSYQCDYIRFTPYINESLVHPECFPCTVMGALARVQAPPSGGVRALNPRNAPMSSMFWVFLIF
jgi:hypothetical protein